MNKWLKNIKNKKKPLFFFSQQNIEKRKLVRKEAQAFVSTRKIVSNAIQADKHV